MKKKLRIGYRILTGGLLLAAWGIKIRKDIRTHRKHEEHNPCACDSQCFACFRS